MALGFLHQRTVLPLFRASSSYALSTLRNGRIAQATRLHVANASRFARRVNSGKSPRVHVPENAPQTVESWSSRAPVPPQKDSWKAVVILLYLAGPCVRAFFRGTSTRTKLTRWVCGRRLLCTHTLLSNLSNSMQRTGNSIERRERRRVNDALSISLKCKSTIPKKLASGSLFMTKYGRSFIHDLCVLT